MAWSEWIDGLTSAGKGAGEVYQAFTADKSSDEAAYLRGANDVLSAQLQQNRDDSTIKVGDSEISTTGLLWIIGGTLGLLTIGLAVKKMM